MKKIQDGDFVRSFYIAPGGVIIWIMERNNEMIVQGIFSMRSWSIIHRPVGDWDIATVEEMLRFIGFQEFPVFSLYEEMTEQERKVLDEHFAIYEKEVERLRAEADNWDKVKENLASAEAEAQRRPRIVKP